MKQTLISFLFFSNVFASDIDLNKAPLEWLVAQTLIEKTDPQGHLIKDKLIKKIFKITTYNTKRDELIINSSKKTSSLHAELVSFLEVKNKTAQIDPLYRLWKNEASPKIKVETNKTPSIQNGFYFFNHIHTNISQDNSGLKFLKISPKKTIKTIKGFLKKRKFTGFASITDHGTDEAFDIIKGLIDKDLGVVRGIEWGGKTHMCLVDIKKNWAELHEGPSYSYEESIIRSQTSEGFRILNHPRKNNDFPYTRWLDVDGVEVWNTIMEDAAFRKLPFKKRNNRAALEQWKLSLKAGKRHTAVAGSDFHFIIPCLRDRSLHYPLNYFPDKGSASLQELIKKGRNSITTMPKAPNLSLTASFNNNWAKMGDEIKGSGDLSIIIRADFGHSKIGMRSVCYSIINNFTKIITFWKKRQWELRFYNKAGELVAKEKIKPRKFGAEKSFISKIKIKVKKEHSDLIRAELWSINKKTKSIDLLALTNPIYINRK